MAKVATPDCAEGDSVNDSNAPQPDAVEIVSLSHNGEEEKHERAITREEIPATIKIALRTLLLDACHVPGTKGRKRELPFNADANNLLSAARHYCAARSFLETYNTLVNILHEGPGRHSLMNIWCDASQPVAGAGSSDAPRRSMHEILAEDPRTQTNFYQLMNDVQRLHKRHRTHARSLHSINEDVASTMSPCITPSSTNVQAPVEDQSRGFTNVHSMPWHTMPPHSPGFTNMHSPWKRMPPSVPPLQAIVEPVIHEIWKRW